MSIKIDKEFENLIPPLTSEEFQQLEENCVREGIRDPLVVWKVPNGDRILVDGHNRWKIAAMHGGIPFQVKEMQFDLREDAKAWIIRNQLGRRNLKIWDAFDLVKQLDEIERTHAKQRQVRKPADSVVEKLPQQKTRDIMGKMIGISGKQYDKMKVIDESSNTFVRDQARKGELSINAAYTMVTHKSPRQQDKEFIEKVKQRHEEFQEHKNDDVVGISEIRKDKDDQDTLASEVWLRVIGAGKRLDELITDIEAGDIDLKLLSANISAEKKETLNKAVTRWLKAIIKIQKEVNA